MRYLVTTNEHPPFLTEWFEPENNFSYESGMIVYDLTLKRYTKDGNNWIDIDIDHL